MCYTKTASGRCMRASAGCRNLFYQNHCRIPCGIHSVFSNTFIFDAENDGKEGYLYSLVTTSIIQGIKSIPVYVEADVSDGMPLFEMVGSLSPEVKESKERVRTALKNTGYILPPKRITINFIPANIRKTGSGFDLPVAAGRCRKGQTRFRLLQRRHAHFDGVGEAAFRGVSQFGRRIADARGNPDLRHARQPREPRLFLPEFPRLLPDLHGHLTRLVELYK